MFKPERKMNNKKKEKEKSKEEKNKKSGLWWNKLNNINNKKERKKYNNNYNGLYKVNVRENCSWNKMCVNNVVPKRIIRDLLDDFL